MLSLISSKFLAMRNIAFYSVCNILFTTYGCSGKVVFVHKINVLEVGKIVEVEGPRRSHGY